MATYRSGPKLLEYHTTEFGKELGTIYYRLNSAWTYTYVKTKEFRILFSNRENLNLINAVAGRFIGSIQNVLFDDILLQLTRITDKAEMGSNKNLTIRMFPRFFDDREKKKIICDLVKEAVEATKFARDWRNKRIAHIDLKFHTDAESNPLQPASLEKVQNALETIHRVLNAVLFIKTGSTLANAVAPYRPKAYELITNIELMKEYLLRAESSGEVRRNSHASRLSDKFRSIREGRNIS